MPDSKRRATFNLERTLESTGHSEDLVRRLVTEGTHSEEIHSIITQNTKHIKIIRYVIKDANIFVISHKSDLHDKFESVLRFEKVKGFSRMVS